MTESQWFACREPVPMLEALGRDASDRKLRLFICACCRRTAAVLPRVWNPTAIEVAERFADGLASEPELREAQRRVSEDRNAARHRIDTETSGGPRHPGSGAELTALHELRLATAFFSRAEPFGRRAAHAVGGAAAAAVVRTAANDGALGDLALDAIRAEEAAQADLVRDLFADRFRFVVPDHSWFTSDVMALANSIYDRHAFEHMPILADALQDAGCDSDAVLAHCRDANRPHARGCWVVDLILGKV